MQGSIDSGQHNYTCKAVLAGGWIHCIRTLIAYIYKNDTMIRYSQC